MVNSEHITNGISLVNGVQIHIDNGIPRGEWHFPGEWYSL